MNRMMKIAVLSLALTGLAAGAPLVAADQQAKTVVGKKHLREQDTSRHEEWLQEQIRHRLAMLLDYTVFDNLAYRVNGSTVELYGQVTRPSLRSGAEKEVKRIEGVEKVVNKIEVLPVSFYDDRLRVQLYRTIFSDNTLSRYSLQVVPPIHIIVNNGHVTLEGVVASKTESNLAFIRANSVPLTFSVQNNLRVEG
ncbi:MAG: BON domain-containing protein [Acidobacteria bacterium]|nr:BON domain-containing protein [Acidobacteriota bacterium]MCL5286683.1 BON domain-containing protein [Acidobacteriota bacterium]